MQLIQQNAFENLQPEVQTQLIELATAMDRHAFENAQESLRGQTELRTKAIEDGAKSRRQSLITLSVLAVLGLIAGTTITVLLISEGEYQLGHTVMMSGLAVVSALLGGAGLTSLFRRPGGPE